MLLVIDVQHGMSVRHQVIADEHAVAVKVHPLGAHVRGLSLGSNRQQSLDSQVELIGHHVVRIITKRLVAQRDIRRMLEDLLSPPTQLLHPGIVDAVPGQLSFQCFAVEMRKSPRHRKRPHIDQGGDSVPSQRGHKFLSGASRMTDGINSRQCVVSPLSRHEYLAPKWWSHTSTSYPRQEFFSSFLDLSGIL